MKRLTKLKIITLLSFAIICILNGNVFAENSNQEAAVIDYFDTDAEIEVLNNVNNNTGSSYELEIPPKEITLLDNNKNLNFVYYDNKYVYIQKLDSNNEIIKTLKIERRYTYFGNITIDSKGNYYIAWGQNDKTGLTSNPTVVTISISKYDNNGNYIKSYEYCGSGLNNGQGDTEIIFSSGSCHMTVNSDGILAICYMHKMKNGHQGLVTKVIDTNTMEKAENRVDSLSTSHAFYADVIPYEKTKGFAFIAQGDGSQRGYNIGVSYEQKSGAWNGKWYAERIVPFHFRNSGVMSYNVTFANYGGIEELDTGLAVVASSDVTYNKPATDRWGESRNVFLQILKHDFLSTYDAYDTLDANAFVTTGERDGIDYGVKWLTNYSNDYTVLNVKTVKVDNDRIAIFWMPAPLLENSSGGYSVSSGYKNNDIFYMVVDNNGNIIQNETFIPEASLPIYDSPVYKDGYIYFTNSNNTKTLRTYRLKLYETEKTTLKLDKYNIELTEPNETYAQKAVLSNGKPVDVTWKSSNSNIASVDDNGIITAKQGGGVTITATSSTYGSTSCFVYVCIPVELSDKSKGYVGDMDRNGFFNSTDSAMILDAYKNLTKDKALLGDVNGDGYVNSTDASYILDWYKSGCFSPGRYYSITDVELNEQNLSIDKGKTDKLVVTILPSNTTDSTIITWTSSDTNIVTVDDEGNIIAIAEGTATITATTSNGKTATCEVTVEIPVEVTGIILNKTSSTLKSKGATESLIATVVPSNANNKGIKWISSNTNVATVDSTGKVTAVANGITTIIVRAQDGSGKTATCEVTVEIPVEVTGIILNKTSSTLKSKGATENLIATVTPNNATNKGIKWISSNTNVATVDSTGKVTAVANGTATITAKAQDGSGKTATCKITVNIPIVNGLKLQAHIENQGWGKWNTYGNAGTTGKGLKLQGIKMEITGNEYSGGIKYKTHIQDKGWETSWKSNGALSGTTTDLRLEAMQVKLTGEIAKYYDVYYRLHVQDYGWLGWAKNGQSAGTEGMSKRVEAIQIKLVKKGEKAPGSTLNYYYKK